MTSNFLAEQQSKGDLLAGRPLITATTTTNNNKMFFLVNNIKDPPPFYSNLSQNWEGGASNIKSISNAYNTNDPPHFLAIFPRTGQDAPTQFTYTGKNESSNHW